jgi:membrane protease YdiL (CAAX protease family)
MAVCAAALVDPLSGLEANEELLSRIGWSYAALIVLGVFVNAALFLRFQATPLEWDRRVETLKNNPWRTSDGARVLLYLVGLYFAVSFTKRMLGGDHEEPPMWVILQSAFFHLSGIAIVVGALKRQGLEWGRAFGIDRNRLAADVRRGVVLYLAMMPLLFFYTLWYQWALRAWGYTALPQDVIILFVSEESIWGRVYTFVLAAMIAPLFEEMVFRGIALPVLARQRGAIWAVVVLAAAFALIHFHVPSLVPLFIVAVTLSVGYIYSGSLVVPIVTHGLFNLVNLTVLAALRSAS